jgi:hypothetical protein
MRLAAGVSAVIIDRSTYTQRFIIVDRWVPGVVRHKRTGRFADSGSGLTRSTSDSAVDTVSISLVARTRAENPLFGFICAAGTAGRAGAPDGMEVDGLYARLTDRLGRPHRQNVHASKHVCDYSGYEAQGHLWCGRRGCLAFLVGEALLKRRNVSSPLRLLQQRFLPAGRGCTGSFLGGVTQRVGVAAALGGRRLDRAGPNPRLVDATTRRTSAGMVRPQTGTGRAGLDRGRSLTTWGALSCDDSRFMVIAGTWSLPSLC